MTTTLSQLVSEYDANAFVLADEGNGCAHGEAGRAVRCDNDDGALLAQYGDIEMVPLDAPHISIDGLECSYASEWMIVGSGDNPYRVRVLF